MEFDENRVYTALNADEVKVGSFTRHTHIQIGGSWIPDEELENWEKVEE